MLFEVHAVYTGRVQGVFFRMTVREHAKALGVVGTVKNLDDGGVEVIVQGSEEVLKKFLDAISTDAGSAEIEGVHQTFQEPKKTYKDFSIIH